MLFDGEKEPTLANPNGIELSRGDRFLYVGISNCENPRHSGFYTFPIDGDGLIDVVAGNAKPSHRRPVDRKCNVFFTAGDTVHVYSEWARPLAKIKIPKGSGTNLYLGQHDRFQRPLCITTNNAVYVVEALLGGL